MPRTLLANSADDSATGNADAIPKLGEYEKTRARNIERNNARLRALGLISALEEKQSNAKAWGVHAPQREATTNDQNTKPAPKKKRKMEKVAKSPTRKSSRLQGYAPDGCALVADDDDDDDDDEPLTKEEQEEERKARVQECREIRQRAALRVMEAGEEQAAKENPTATYAHALKRVRTMTEKGLQNRVKAIERAAGKHCVVKMAIFKSCLQDESMWELADLASEALERLKALQAPPEE